MVQTNRPLFEKGAVLLEKIIINIQRDYGY